MRLPGSAWALLGVPAFLYVGLDAILGVDAAAAAVALGVLAIASVLVVLPYLTDHPVARLGAAGVYLFLVLAVVSVVGSGALSAVGGSGIALGALAAGPMVVLLGTALYEGGLGTRVVGLALACTDGLVLLSATTAAPALGSASLASDRVLAYFDVISSQLHALESALAGGSASLAPLAGASDPAFVALTGLALLGTLLAIVRPASGRGDPLPAVEPSRVPEAPPELPLSSAFVQVLAERSRPEPPPPGRLPGFPSLLTGLLAGGIVLALLYGSPASALLAVGIGAILGVAVVIGVLRTSAAAGSTGASAAPVAAGARERG
ncbi:MAG TPA: hypothetical protein VMG14_05715 [Thermoplasmata archaeon]|nr:hypothetical protein [Thermoplasmata archaeon]